ncbi:ABC transporter, ATP-binding protein [endosymbiont GvMRE of Glomus versiforme]|nr:ABC transporter, ATP-binding protein [endosymbiont GvMRE of Glomus versiforme]
MSPPKENQKQKINFWTLYEKFKFKVIRNFLLATILTVLSVFLMLIIDNLVSKKKIVDDNYSLLLPKILRGCFTSLTKEKFILLGIILVFLYALTFYFSSLWEEELRVQGGHYVKNHLLDKFRQLPFEEREKRSKEINILVEFDSGEIGYTWEHLPNHVYHSLLTIILLISLRWGKFSKMDNKMTFFSCFWLLLINIVSYFFTRLVLRNEKKYKKELTKEWTVINKETEKANLIESMGLTPQYRDKQIKVSHTNEKLVLSFNRTKSLNKTIPVHWLAEMFPYLLLFIVGTFSEAGQNILPMWWIFENFQEIFKCFWEYGEYASSLNRVNRFLSLPEKNDNLQGTIFPKEVVIKAINFEEVSFKYQDSSEWILENYTHSFTKGEVKLLLGENGIGKSTILYLILGVIKPQKGQVMVECQDGQIYNLYQDINLRHWRENNVAYASHDNLIETGSTGQRQLANINNLFITRNQAVVFLLDETDNALDQEKQKEFERKLKDLARDKLVIYTKH